VLLEAPALDERELAVRARIDELGDSLRFQLRTPNRWTGALRRTTFARNVQGSNSIEGIHASVDDVAAIAAGEKPPSVSEETERALAGYQLAMTYVLQLAKSASIDLNVTLINALHFMIGSYDLTRMPGRLRDRPVYVLDERTRDIVHEGADAAKLPELMAEITDAASNPGDRLIAAAMAHLNFVLVHPYLDGNGRTARVLQALVLAGDAEPQPLFMSIEEYLGTHTPAYYDVLAKVGGGEWPPKDMSPEAVRPWIRFVLTAHLNQAEERVERIRASGEAYSALENMARRDGLPERSLEAVFDVLLGSTITRGRYLAALTEAGEPISEQTATRDLTALVQVGLLSRSGDKRGARYSAGKRTIELRDQLGLGRVRRDVEPFAD